jgi:hypothetical protein
MEGQEHRSTPADLTEVTWELLARNKFVQEYFQRQKAIDALQKWPEPTNVTKTKKKKKSKKSGKKA